jgi:allantoicase
MSQNNTGQMIELSAAANDGVALDASDEHYGSIHNILKPGRGIDMGDGWETRRRREPGYDWIILKLGHAGLIDKIEIDTAHYKGNFPHQISINAAYLPNDCDKNMAPRSLYWDELLPLQLLEMDKQHFFEHEIVNIGPVTHVRVNIHPDGGLSRVRFFGTPASS